MLVTKIPGHHYVCDGKCEKAFGINLRPRILWSRDPDDYTWLADQEIPFDAPKDPGSYEGGHAKPQELPQEHNKWCVRECERCEAVKEGETPEEAMRDFSKRMSNDPDRATMLGEGR